VAWRWQVFSVVVCRKLKSFNCKETCKPAVIIGGRNLGEATVAQLELGTQFADWSTHLRRNFKTKKSTTPRLDNQGRLRCLAKIPSTTWSSHPPPLQSSPSGRGVVQGNPTLYIALAYIHILFEARMYVCPRPSPRLAQSAHNFSRTVVRGNRIAE